jgi:hypothetical protein
MNMSGKAFIFFKNTKRTSTQIKDEMSFGKISVSHITETS